MASPHAPAARPPATSVILAAVVGFVAPVIPVGVVLFIGIWLNRYAVLPGMWLPVLMESVIVLVGAVVAAGAYSVGFRHGARPRDG